MKTATIIITIIGVLLAAGFGIFWVTDYKSAEEDIATVEELGIDTSSVSDLSLDDYKARRNSGYALIAGSVLSLVAVLLIGKLKKFSSLLILLSAIVPAILFPNSLIFSFLLIIGGILAFFVKPKVVTEQAQVQA